MKVRRWLCKGVKYEYKWWFEKMTSIAWWRWRKHCFAEKVDVVNGDVKSSCAARDVCFDVVQEALDWNICVVGENWFLCLVFVRIEMDINGQNWEGAIGFVLRSVLRHVDFEETACFVAVYSCARDIDVCTFLHVINLGQNQLRYIKVVSIESGTEGRHTWIMSLTTWMTLDCCRVSDDATLYACFLYWLCSAELNLATCTV